MSDLLEDMLNLEILENLCSGVGVEVNINALSKVFKRHRNTVKAQVDNLFENNIINKPIYPFIWLHKEYPLLVIARADLPRNESIDEFLRNDEHTFGVFYVRDEEYNVLLIEYHKDIYTYGKWKEEIVSKNMIPPRETRFPAHSLFFSNNNIIKYQPDSPVLLMGDSYKNGHDISLNGFRMNHLSFQILKKLTSGEGIRTNENMLAEKLGVNRKTIERHIEIMLKEKIIKSPVCRFPKFFVPPGHILVYALIEIKKAKDKIVKALATDPHVPIIMDANIGRYTLLLFKVFSNVEEHFKWEEQYDNRFTGCIGAMKKLFLSPHNTVSIDQQKVSLGIIRQRKEFLHGRELIDSISK